MHVIDERGESLFNVGMPIVGGTYEHVFERAGDYRVGCNIHQQMSATVRVTASPFIAIADRDGSFAISGVPYGVYDVEVRRGPERVTRGRDRRPAHRPERHVVITRRNGARAACRYTYPRP